MPKRDMIALLVIILCVLINILVLRFFSVCDVDKDIDKRKSESSLN